MKKAFLLFLTLTLPLLRCGGWVVYIPPFCTTPNGYFTRYQDDPSSGDFFPVRRAHDAHDSLESSHARYSHYGFRAPYFYPSLGKEMAIFDSDDVGTCTPVRITLDAPSLRNEPEPRIRSTVLHELFHNVEFAYIDFFQWQSWGPWAVEGMARLMEDKTFQDLDTDTPNTLYLGEVNGYLFDPDRPLMDLSYASCLFWNYLAEQYGSNSGDFSVGTDVLRTFWQKCREHSPDSLRYLNETIAEFDRGRELKDIFIDFLITNYTKDLDLSALPNASRYSYVDDDDTDANNNPILYVDVDRTRHVIPPNVINQEDDVPHWAGKWYEARVFGTAPIVGFQAHSTNSVPLAAAAISVRGTNRVGQVFKSNGYEFRIAFYSRASDPITSVGAVVGGLDNDVEFTYTFATSTAVLTIESPTSLRPASVGPKDNPERFVAKVRVKGTAVLGSPSVRGLHFTDFVARVGTEGAQILDGAYVQGEYWLLIQAPRQTDAAEEYPLAVSLGTSSAEQKNAVVYRKMIRDQIFLIDTSGSMRDGGKIDAAKNAASLLVDTKPDGDMLGVVRFHGNAEEPDVDATVVSTLSNVDNAARTTAKSLIDAIPVPSPEVRTSIGDGLNVSEIQLNTRGRRGDRRFIILLSDGMENEALMWEDVKPDILATGTIVHTVALGPGDHHLLMESIANDTGGEYYFTTTTVSGALAPEPDPLGNRLADVYKQIEEEIVGHQRLWYAKGQIGAGEKTQHGLPITEERVEDAVVAVNWANKGDELDVVLEDPSGNTIQPSTPGVQYFKAPTHAVYHLPNMRKGGWGIHIASAAGGPTDYVASVAARVEHGVDLDVYIRQHYSGRWAGIPVEIVANVNDSKGAIRGASVVATVLHPSGSSFPVELQDDGSHMDENADDGIYANDFTRTTDGGSYVVEVKATGTSNKSEPFERIKSRFFYVRYDPGKTDSDMDGMPDPWEELHGLVVGVDDSGKDRDADGLPNIQEFRAGTYPTNPDTDGGGESDFSELNRGSDPCNRRDDSIPRPVDVGIVNVRTDIADDEKLFQPNANLIRFPVNPAYKSVLLFRHKGPAASAAEFSQVAEIDPKKYPGLYPDEELSAGVEFFYFLVADGLSGARSARSPIFSGTPRSAPPPAKGWLKINHGAWRATSLDATLTFDPNPDWKEVIVSNKSSFDGAVWKAKPPSMEWTLERLPGTSFATVYAKFRDAAGNVSVLEHDSVAVDLDADADNDGFRDSLDLDNDNDALPDVLEVLLGLDPFRPDSDGDGTHDEDEDTDGDGQSNYIELVSGSDIGNPSSTFSGHANEAALDRIVIQWPYVPRRIYRLLSSDDVASGKWEPVPGKYEVEGNTASQEDSTAGAARRFYRVEASGVPPDDFAALKLLLEDFDNGVANGFTEVGGAWGVAEGKYVQSVTDPPGPYRSWVNAVREYALEVDITPVSATETKVIYAHADAGENHRVDFWLDRSRLSMPAWGQTWESRNFTVGGLNLSYNQTYRVRIEVNLQGVKVWLDGALRHDQPWANGEPLGDAKVGVGTTGGTARFDNLAVSMGAPTAVLLLSEDFNDGVANGFTEVGGIWMVIKGKYIQSAPSPPGPSRSWVDAARLGEYTLEVDYTPLSGEETKVIYAHAEIGEDYRVDFFLDRCRLCMPAWGEPWGNRYFVTEGLTLSYNQTYHVRVQVSLTGVKVWVDDILQHARPWANADPLRDGRVGLGTYSSVSSFDNLIVHLPCFGPVTFYREDFNDGAADGFVEAGGSWSVQDGKYVQVTQNPPGPYRCWVESRDVTEYTVEVDFAPLSGTETRVIYAHADTGENYRVDFFPGGCRLSMPAWGESWETRSFDVAGIPLSYNQIYHVKVEVSLARVKVWLDGALRHSQPWANDQPLGDGKVGLGTYAATSNFDNMTVTVGSPSPAAGSYLGGSTSVPAYSETWEMTIEAIQEDAEHFTP